MVLRLYSREVSQAGKLNAKQSKEAEKRNRLHGRLSPHRRLQPPRDRPSPPLHLTTPRKATQHVHPQPRAPPLKCPGREGVGCTARDFPLLIRPRLGPASVPPVNTEQISLHNSTPRHHPPRPPQNGGHGLRRCWSPHPYWLVQNT